MLGAAEHRAQESITMTTYITIRNNSKTATIHCAISWGGIQQDYRNDIGPNGGYAEYELNDWGDHDLTIIWGTNENRFKSENNNKLDFRKLLALVMCINNPSAQMTQALLGSALKVRPGEFEPGDVKIVMSRPPKVKPDGSVEVPLQTSVNVYPVLITGLHTLNGNDIVVTGGDLIGEYVKATKTYYIYGTEPLKAHWSNRLSNKSEADYVARSP
jgi:hypothetical protein